MKSHPKVATPKIGSKAMPALALFKGLGPFFMNPKVWLVIGAVVAVLYFKNLWEDKAVLEYTIQRDAEVAEAAKAEVQRQLDEANEALAEIERQKQEADEAAAALRERADEFARLVAEGGTDKCAYDPSDPDDAYNRVMQSIR